MNLYSVCHSGDSTGPMRHRQFKNKTRHIYILPLFLLGNFLFLSMTTKSTLPFLFFWSQTKPRPLPPGQQLTSLLTNWKPVRPAAVFTFDRRELESSRKPLRRRREFTGRSERRRRSLRRAESSLFSEGGGALQKGAELDSISADDCGGAEAGRFPG